jgi:hypothetical protein
VTVLDKTRAAKLRRIPDAAFAQEADRRGFDKKSPNIIPMPRQLLAKYEAELRERGMHMIAEPAHAVNDLGTVRAMITTADWIKTFIELHDGDLESRGVVAE